MADGPHDSQLPAREVVNCRCRLIPVVYLTFFLRVFFSGLSLKSLSAATSSV